MSNKKKYQSILGAKGLITASNYLAELIIKKRSDSKGIKLPNRIWSEQFKKDIRYKYWHNSYFGELVHACSLLKKYDMDCILSALNSPECKVILSLKNVKLDRIAQEYQEKKKLEDTTQEKISLVTTDINSQPRPKLGVKNKLSKLA